MQGIDDRVKPRKLAKDETTEDVTDVKEPKAYNDTCSICLDGFKSTEDPADLSIGNPADLSILLDCSHRLHVECLKGLVTQECPVCRVKIEKLPNEVEKAIAENKKKYAQEKEVEERNDILQFLREEFQAMTGRTFGGGGAIFPEPIIGEDGAIDPQLENMLAMHYLLECDVSPHFIPRELRFSVAPGDRRMSICDRLINEYINLFLRRAEDIAMLRLHTIERMECDFDTEDDSSLECGELECDICGAPLDDTGRVRRDPDDDSDDDEDDSSVSPSRYDGCCRGLYTGGHDPSDCFGERCMDCALEGFKAVKSHLFPDYDMYQKSERKRMILKLKKAEYRMVYEDSEFTDGDDSDDD